MTKQIRDAVCGTIQNMSYRDTDGPYFSVHFGGGREAPCFQEGGAYYPAYEFFWFRVPNLLTEGSQP